MKKSMSAVALGASALLIAGAIVPTTANAVPKGKKCNNGTFHVLHTDKINDVKIRKGYYKMRVRKMNCGQASTYFHNFLEHGETYDDFLVAAGTWGNKPKRTKMFIQGQSGPFFQIKRVNNPS